jgi:hypothetical protein
VAATTHWNPWSALRQTDIRLWFAWLDGEHGRWEQHADGEAIVLDARLGRRHRQEVLAHELVHAERRVGWPAATAATMELEEERVWRVALDRLAPPSAVREFVERRATAGPVTIDDLAEEFDLSLEAAQRVAELLRVRSPSG